MKHLLKILLIFGLFALNLQAEDIYYFPVKDNTFNQIAEVMLPASEIKAIGTEPEGHISAWSLLEAISKRYNIPNYWLELATINEADDWFNTTLFNEDKFIDKKNLSKIEISDTGSCKNDGTNDYKIVFREFDDVELLGTGATAFDLDFARENKDKDFQIGDIAVVGVRKTYEVDVSPVHVYGRLLLEHQINLGNNLDNIINWEWVAGTLTKNVESFAKVNRELVNNKKFHSYLNAAAYGGCSIQ